jgi:hypothetical protein
MSTFEKPTSRSDYFESHPLAQLAAGLSLVEKDGYDAGAPPAASDDNQPVAPSPQERAARQREEKQQRAATRIQDAERRSAAPSTVAMRQTLRRRRLVKAALPWTTQDPPFELARRGAFFGMDRLHPTDLVHVLSLGGTGVGKTVSTIVPALGAILRYQLPTATGFKRTAMFIVDPKCELLPFVVKSLTASGELHRLRHLGVDDTVPPVGFFEVNDGLSPRDKLSKLEAVLRTDELSVDNLKYWHEAGLLIVQQFMQLEQDYRARNRDSLLAELTRRLDLAVAPDAGFWAQLSAFLSRSKGRKTEFDHLCKTLEATLDYGGLEAHADAEVMSSFAGNDENNIQWHYRLQSVQPMASLLGDLDIAAVVDFDPFPDGCKPRVDICSALDDGLVLLHQPEPSETAELAARAIKTKVFEAVKSRNDMERPVGIVIDEFQKFISCDPVTGDATFLDTARAYRANCVLATQSIGALLLALGSTPQARSAVDAIVANTPSKFFFASKDRQTSQELRALIPGLPGGQHVLDIRTLAQLKPGEAYWSLADGRWGRGRAQRHDLL